MNKALNYYFLYKKYIIKIKTRIIKTEFVRCEESIITVVSWVGHHADELELSLQDAYSFIIKFYFM